MHTQNQHMTLANTYLNAVQNASLYTWKANDGSWKIYDKPFQAGTDNVALFVGDILEASAFVEGVMYQRGIAAHS